MIECNLVFRAQRVEALDVVIEDNHLGTFISENWEQVVRVLKTDMPSVIDIVEEEGYEVKKLVGPIGPRCTDAFKHFLGGCKDGRDER